MQHIPEEGRERGYERFSARISAQNACVDEELKAKTVLIPFSASFSVFYFHLRCNGIYNSTIRIPPLSANDSYAIAFRTSAVYHTLVVPVFSHDCICTRRDVQRRCDIHTDSGAYARKGGKHVFRIGSYQ